MSLANVTLPYGKLGYKSVHEMVVAMPDVVRIER